MGEHRLVVRVQTVFGVEEDVNTMKPGREGVRNGQEETQGSAHCFLVFRYSSNMSPHSGLPLLP